MKTNNKNNSNWKQEMLFAFMAGNKIVPTNTIQVNYLKSLIRKRNKFLEKCVTKNNYYLQIIENTDGTQKESIQKFIQYTQSNIDKFKRQDEKLKDIFTKIKEKVNKRIKINQMPNKIKYDKDTNITYSIEILLKDKFMMIHNFFCKKFDKYGLKKLHKKQFIRLIEKCIKKLECIHNNIFEYIGYRIRENKYFKIIKENYNFNKKDCTFIKTIYKFATDKTLSGTSQINFCFTKDIHTIFENQKKSLTDIANRWKTDLEYLKIYESNKNKRDFKLVEECKSEKLAA